MKKLLFFVTGTLLFASCAGTKDVAKNAFEGKIVYELEYEDVPEELEAYISMFPSESVTYMGKGFTRAEQDMGMGSKQTVISEVGGKTIMLLDMMGQKIMVDMTTPSTDDETEPKVEVTNETETIAGYACKKAIITTAGGDEFEVFFTEEIPNGNSQFKALSGMPMQFETEANGMTVITRAKTVEAMKVADVYKEVPEGYTEMTMEELEALGGGF